MNYGLVSLCEDDYFWVTHRLRAVAQATCNRPSYITRIYIYIYMYMYIYSYMYSYM